MLSTCSRIKSKVAVADAQAIKATIARFCGGSRCEHFLSFSSALRVMVHYTNGDFVKHVSKPFWHYLKPLMELKVSVRCFFSKDELLLGMQLIRNVTDSLLA